MQLQLRLVIAGLFLALIAGSRVASARTPRKFVDAEKEFQMEFGPTFADCSQAEISEAIVRMAEQLPVGGAIDLPRSVSCGILDFRRVADRVQVTGGHDGAIILGGGQSGLELMFSSLEEEIRPGLRRPPARIDPDRVDRWVAANDFRDVQIFGAATAPATDLLAIFNQGGIKIASDVRHCAWIAGENAFGAHTVTADARLDDSLLLWFGINWPFQDYNQHWNPKNAGRDWVKTNAQLYFNLHGGGTGTRLYEMIETSYGNPGPTAVFENCNGLAAYHGSTERASSQGPGVYYLKNCVGMQLGLRGINAFGVNNGDPRAADANRDITIEGGQGNILYAMRTWSNANEVSLWNSDPKLQLWEVASQYGQQGTENAFRFAVTPYYGRPTPEYLAKLNLPALARDLRTPRAEDENRRESCGLAEPELGGTIDRETENGTAHGCAFQRTRRSNVNGRHDRSYATPSRGGDDSGAAARSGRECSSDASADRLHPSRKFRWRVAPSGRRSDREDAERRRVFTSPVWHES